MAITAFREGGLADDGGDVARKRRKLRIPLDCSTAEAARMLRLRFNREAECAWPAPPPVQHFAGAPFCGAADCALLVRRRVLRTFSLTVSPAPARIDIRALQTWAVSSAGRAGDF